jgi:hypothetical protein
MIYMVFVLPDPRPVPKYGSGSVLKWFRIQVFLTRIGWFWEYIVVK